MFHFISHITYQQHQHLLPLEESIIKIKMSDNIPLELQELIINKLPVEPLIRFRTVCKARKSLIDSSDFIRNHIKQQNQQHLLVKYQDAELKYVSIPDNDTDTFPQNTASVTVPQLVVNMHRHEITIDSSHGLLCLFGYFDRKAIIWNPSIRKAVDVALHLLDRDVEEMSAIFLGFGVCVGTRDPKIVKIRIEGKEGVVPWQVEVFTLSTRVWRSAYSSNLPSKFVRFGGEQMVVDGVVYWQVNGDVRDRANGEGGYGNLIVSFDLTSEEFGEVKLPVRLANTPCGLCMFKPRESLAVIEGLLEDSKLVYHVWVMKDGVPKLFEKLFTISGHTPDGSLVSSVLGFRKAGEALVELQAHPFSIRTLATYEPYSKAINNLGVSGRHISVYSYTETLLLLDQPDITN
ncbi:putative F-box domain-containing protein [Helianthus annuus]|nr:putative F-box protein At1g32420 [Helianthus annuus]XP_021998673.1 putative F-box protein At1g32420 [Helianthus annuus]XP_021998674.1 putative F-box protein At1g32420 [Helianthus annuus]XP_021998675.1 putative F-box protein At1g32420 [Helianthus annuus]KAJ0490811.1 putative F-box domain-containing protein [Helianthus annuus]KAJ0506715.1 putative F-box domain-containing protein [Helianthus annuus]KAJ0676395.1 putative F-box domain-containing protein [Helianthus annuus]KAJ0679607.1 putative